MTASHRVTRESYEGLRDETLAETVPWLGGRRFAQVASWAVWASPRDPDTRWSRDLSVLTWDNLSGQLHSHVVFVALNKGVNPVAHAEADWANFHSGRADYKLARAIGRPGVRDVLVGAYMTDYFKGLPTPTGADLERHLESLTMSERTKTVDAMVALLERELELLGSDEQTSRPLLVGVGRAARTWLEQTMAHRPLASITHYAHAVGQEAYASELAGIAELVLDRTRRQGQVARETP